MRVQVLYFGVLKELFGCGHELLEIAEGTDIAGLLARCRQAQQAPAELWNSLAVAVNLRYAPQSQVLRDGDEVALLPPVSGGLNAQMPLVEITDSVIPAAEIVARLKSAADGAVSVFDGIVRNHTRGRKTLYLVYEAYREMALGQMQSLANEAIARFGARDVAVVHRIGRLEVGETSVLIVVASEHRGAAFDACRWIIDTLKKTVPIWKKEYFEGGAVWADGEPFPDELAGSASI